MLTCPETSILSSMLAGTLPAGEWNEVEQHVETCEICAATLESLSGDGATLLPGLTNLSPDAFECEAKCVEIVEALATGVPQNAVDSPPEVLGPYEIEGQLGAGGVGTVYKARHDHLNKTVAVKVLNDAGNAEVVQRFLREMKATGGINHPNIVRATDGGIHNGRHYLVMEFLDGFDLSTLYKRLGQIAVADACDMIRQAALGLQEIHEFGLVHRDIKPRNLMLARSENGPIVKILDLGLASEGSLVSHEGTALTSTGQVMGTLDYMAPEQGFDSRDVDIRTDIYSLGATLYRLLTGRALYSGTQYQSFGRKFNAILNESPPPAKEFRSDLPPELADFLNRMIARERSDRPAEPVEVAQTLKQFSTAADLSALLQRAEQLEIETGKEASPATLQNTLPSFAGGTISSALEPAVQSPRAVSNWFGRRAAKWVAVAAVMVLLWLGNIIYVEFGKATLKIDIKDPSVVVKFTGTEVKINNGQSIRLKPGEHQLTVLHAGVEFRTTEFTLIRRGRELLTVERVDGEITIARESDGATIGRHRFADPAITGGKAKDSPPSEVMPRDRSELESVSEAELAHNRSAAEWVIEQGGRIRAQRHGQWLNSVPEGKFRVLEIQGRTLASPEFDLSEIGRLNGLKSLETLLLPNSNDAAIEKLDDLPALETLVLSNEAQDVPGNEITDAVVPMLQRYPLLTAVAFRATKITPKGLVQIARHPSAQRYDSFSVISSEVNDNVLAAISQLPGLNCVELGGCRGITVNGVASLARLKPATLSLFHVPLTRQMIEPLRNIRKLRILNLSRSGLAYEDLAILNNNVQLEQLDITQIEGTRAEFDALRKALPSTGMMSDFGMFESYQRETGRDRAAAEWVVSQGGRIRTTVSGPVTDTIPTEPFHLYEIWGDGRVSRKLDMTQINRLNGLQRLRRLQLANWNADAFHQLDNLPDLDTLLLDNSMTPAGYPRTTDADIHLVKQYPKLVALSFDSTDITVNGLIAVTELPQASQLRNLTVRRETLNDDVLQAFGSLKSLTVLSLDYCDGVTANGLDRLEKTPLIALSMFLVPLTPDGIDAIARMKSLELLSVSNSSLSFSDLKPLAELPRLKSLSITEVRGSREELQELRLALPDVNIVSDFGDMPRIGRGTPQDRRVAEWLLVSGTADFRINGQNQVYRFGDELPAGPLRLTEIFPSTKAIQDHGDVVPMVEIGRLNGLKHLTAFSSHVGLHDVVFSKLPDLPALTELQLSRHPNPPEREKITDRSIDYVLRYPNLKLLSLACTEVSDGGIERLLLAPEMQNLERLRLGLTAVSGRGLAAASRLPRLRELHLESCDAVVPHFHLLRKTRLQHVNLYAIAMTDKLAEDLAAMPALEVLNADSTGITPKQIGMFTNHPTLRELWCNGNSLTSSVLETALPGFQIDPDRSMRLVRE